MGSEVKSQPYVFILDLDNTIIGNIKPQVILWELSKGSIKTNSIKMDSKGLQQKMVQGQIIRPGFLEFVKYIQSLDYLLYVYTASEKTWANYIITHIEKTLKIRFERPIFTRKECIYQNGNFKKSVRTLLPIITKNLRGKGQILNQQRLTIIDNLNVYHAGDQANLVICPSYEVIYPENIGAYISYQQFKDNQTHINRVLEKYIPSYHATSDYWTFQKRMSVYYLQTIADMPKLEPQDSFFGVLTTFLKTHPKHKFAKYINRHIIRK